MIQTNTQQRPESRLRRWWRSFYAAVQQMDSSGYEVMGDRMNYLEERVRRLEALNAFEEVAALLPTAQIIGGPLPPTPGASHVR